jgi:hypothetical protein
MDRRLDVGTAYGHDAVQNNEQPVKPNRYTHNISKTVPDASLQTRLYEFYSRHQPTIAPRARVIAKHFEGREDVLNINLQQTYGVDLTSDEPFKASNQVQSMDVTNTGYNEHAIKDDAKFGANRAAHQARPISEKQFMALLHQKDIVPR